MNYRELQALLSTMLYGEGQSFHGHRIYPFSLNAKKAVLMAEWERLSSQPLTGQFCIYEAKNASETEQDADVNTDNVDAIIAAARAEVEANPVHEEPALKAACAKWSEPEFSTLQEVQDAYYELNKRYKAIETQMVEQAGWKHNHISDVATRRTVIGSLHEYQQHTSDSALKSCKVSKELKEHYINLKQQMQRLSEMADNLAKLEAMTYEDQEPEALPEPTYSCTPTHMTPHWESELHTRLTCDVCNGQKCDIEPAKAEPIDYSKPFRNVEIVDLSVVYNRHGVSQDYSCRFCKDKGTFVRATRLIKRTSNMTDYTYSDPACRVCASRW